VPSFGIGITGLCRTQKQLEEHAMLNMKKLTLAATAATLVAGPALAESLTISTGLPQNHNWVFGHMEPFIAAMERDSNGAISFIPFIAGELTPVSRELDALQGGTVDVIGNLLSPFQEGRFRLSDVTQLPVYGSDSHDVTRAFQNVLDSDVEIAPGQTFWDYEIAPKGIRVWALGATAAYSVSTTSVELVQPSDFRGLPLRTGTAIHTMVLENLGANPVIIPGVQMFEAMSRGTISGTIQSVADWQAYALQQLLRYSVMDVSLGHWQSYLAIRDDVWNRLSPEMQTLWDETARRTSLENSDIWEAIQQETIELATAQYGARFVSVFDLSEEMQQHFANAASQTWQNWVNRLEGEGLPARAVARLYAEFITAEGAVLPEGVAEFLGL
jgi:TRAP-type C4-dicarboxylate transport system substrate-binding protein